MSSPEGRYFQERRDIDVAVSANLAALAMLSYDYVLCMSREIETIWLQPFQLSTVIYFVTRYLPFSCLVFSIVVVPSMSSENESTSTPSQSCIRALHATDAMALLVLTAVTGVLVAQTYAIYNQNRLVLVVLTSLGVVIIVLDCFAVAADTCIVDPLEVLPRSVAGAITLLVTMTVFSVAVMVLTMYKLFRISQQQNLFGQSLEATSLTGIIIRESVAMLGVSVLRLFNILLYVLASDTLNLVVNPLVLPIAAIFICHFLMNLRRVAQSARGSATRSLSPVLTTSFARDIDAQLSISCSFLSDFAVTQAVYRGSFCESGSLQVAVHSRAGSRSRERRESTPARSRSPRVDEDIWISEARQD